MGRRETQILIASLALWAVGASLASVALACRCAQRDLGDYFSDADEVFVARLDSTTTTTHGEPADGDDPYQVFEFSETARRFKSTDAGPRRYLGHRSSAACPVVAEIGAIYIVFADEDPDSDTSWLSSCNGTRRHISSTLPDPQGFEDVPARFVIQQLQAQEGLDYLRQVAAHEPRQDDPESVGLVGMLDIPALAHGGFVELHAEPDVAAPKVAKVDSLEDLDHRERGYEVDAAVVLAKLDFGYKLQLTDGTIGWLPAAQGSNFELLEANLVNRLTYLNEHWNGLVWPDLGAGLPIQRPHDDKIMVDRNEYAVRILESRRLAGSLWLRVEVLRTHPCAGGAEPPKVHLAGWIPAYGASGEPVAWFYSRGC